MIDVRYLTVRFDEKLVLDDVSCRIMKGQITSIIGKSGMGKSVLMKAVLGLLPYKGDVTIDGLYLQEEKKKVRAKTAMLFQNSALFDSMNVFQNIAFPLFEHKKMPYREMREKAGQMLHLVDLPDVLELYPAELSGGMRKRVALARAIIQEPEYLIYDEPTTGLDPITADGIIKLIDSIHKQLSMTSIVITHDPECIKTLTETLIMIDDKKIIYCDDFTKFHEYDHPTANSFRDFIFSKK